VQVNVASRLGKNFMILKRLIVQLLVKPGVHVWQRGPLQGPLVGVYVSGKINRFNYSFDPKGYWHQQIFARRFSGFNGRRIFPKIAAVKG